MIKKILVGVMLSIMSFCAAATVLDAEQKNAVVRELLKNKDYAAAQRVLNEGVAAETVLPEKRIVENAKEWATLGTNLGSAMVSAAKELGMATAQFAETPLGKVTTAIVAYKIIGKDIIRTVLALAVFVSGMLVLPFVYRYIAYSRVEYEYVPTLFGLYSRKKIKEIHMFESSDGSAGFCVFAGILGSFVLVCFATWLMLPI